MKWRPLTKYLTTLALSAVLYLPSLALVISTKTTVALSASDWRVGRIMDDAVFFNPNAMNAQDIQNFLNAKVPACDTWGQVGPYRGYPNRAEWAKANGKPQPPYICLKEYSQNIPDRGSDSYCSGSVSGGNKSAAQIIYDVAQACSVNPKVLIVLLQKEQALVTDDWPWPVQYEKATGYGCPDTAPCDPTFAGFFNQVWYAARQFQRYAKQPSLFNHRGGQTSLVLYNPNTSCGGTDVYMQNQATAGLYNYTPYQPNAAALSNLYGSGDSCSAYGNRNFWRLFIDWFGSPYSTTAFAWMYEGQEFFSDSARTKRFTSTPTASPGGKIYVRVKARNMGIQTWDKSFLRVGTSRPTDRLSPFVDSSWLSSTRPAALIENSITPGAIGTFEFVMQVPNVTGTYIEHFNLVADGHTWLNDLNLHFPINVVEPIAAPNSTKIGLSSGESIQKGEYLLSPDTQSVLILQPDGNLVFYSNLSRVIWHANTVGKTSKHLVMQSDGNLVLYDQNNNALWNSGTFNNPLARLSLQTDGNLVIYSQTNSALWSVGHVHNPNHLAYVNYELPAAHMYPGQLMETANRRYRLVLQTDGNLVLYSPNRATWSSQTNGKAISRLAMQPDGNLVLYDNSNQPVWHTGTNSEGASYLTVQPDGNLVLYLSNSKLVTWHSQTAGVL